MSRLLQALQKIEAKTPAVMPLRGAAPVAVLTVVPPAEVVSVTAAPPTPIFTPIVEELPAPVLVTEAIWLPPVRETPAVNELSHVDADEALLNDLNRDVSDLLFDAVEIGGKHRTAWPVFALPVEVAVAEEVPSAPVVEVVPVAPAEKVPEPPRHETVRISANEVPAAEPGWGWELLDSPLTAEEEAVAARLKTLAETILQNREPAQASSHKVEFSIGATTVSEPCFTSEDNTSEEVSAAADWWLTAAGAAPLETLPIDHPIAARFMTVTEPLPVPAPEPTPEPQVKIPETPDVVRLEPDRHNLTAGEFAFETAPFDALGEKNGAALGLSIDEVAAGIVAQQSSLDGRVLLLVPASREGLPPTMVRALVEALNGFLPRPVKLLSTSDVANGREPLEAFLSGQRAEGELILVTASAADSLTLARWSNHCDAIYLVVAADESPLRAGRRLLARWPYLEQRLFGCVVTGGER